MSCRVCTHPKTEEIERQLRAGAPLKSVANDHNIAIHNLRYHLKNHMGRGIKRRAVVLVSEATERRLAEQAKTPQDELTPRLMLMRAHARAEDIAERCVLSDHSTGAIQANRDCIAAATALDKLDKDEQDKATSTNVNILATPEWGIFMSLLFEMLPETSAARLGASMVKLFPQAFPEVVVVPEAEPETEHEAA